VWIIKKPKNFKKRFNKLIPKHLQQIVIKKIQNLTNSPYVGKPLGYKYLREIKIEKWRVYFSIDKEHNIIYCIDVSDKKAQKETITKIKIMFKGRVQLFLQ